MSDEGGPSPDGGNDVPALLSLRGLSKSFGPVQALSKVDVDVPPGKVTSLAGDNGAGKSVLIKTVSGLWEPDEGQIQWEGRRVHLRGPKDAEALGITTIYQDLALCDNLDIVQNMFLGRERHHGPFLDESSMEQAAGETLASLSGGQRQSVAVAKAVMANAQLVIMDEPTAALGVAQTRMVLDLIRRLSGHGVAVIVISHNLNDVFEVADRIAILYLGHLVHTGPANLLDRQAVVDYMTTGTSTRTGGETSHGDPSDPS